MRRCLPVFEYYCHLVFQICVYEFQYCARAWDVMTIRIHDICIDRCVTRWPAEQISPTGMSLPRFVSATLQKCNAFSWLLGLQQSPPAHQLDRWVSHILCSFWIFVNYTVFKILEMCVFYSVDYFACLSSHYVKASIWFKDSLISYNNILTVVFKPLYVLSFIFKAFIRGCFILFTLTFDA